MERIILDTDAGSDPDDATALSLAMLSPEIVLEGVTTVYGDIAYRTRLVKKLLDLGGRSDVKIYAGLQETLLRNRDVWWGGRPQEGETAESAGHAVDFMINTIMGHPGEITLVAIGPLTNVAVAIIREPRIIHNVKEILIMGGVVRLGNNGADLPAIEHNMKCDPEAASVVFSSGAPITMVGLDVTTKVQIGLKEVELLRGSRKPLNLALAEIVVSWLERIGRDATAMHDPLAVSLLLDRRLVRTRRMKVSVEYDRREPSGMTIAIPSEEGNVEVCLDVDSGKFIDMLFHRLTS